MARKGKKFEQAYAWLYGLEKSYTVTSPAYLYDKAADEKREIDVLVEYTDCNGFPRKICIECRDRGKAQDVMWIEQLQQKREDLGLDYIIATTTSTFTAGAIKKAKYHGVIIERAEMLNEKTLTNNVSKFFFDLLCFKFELIELRLHTISRGYISLQQHLKSLNVFERHAFLAELNKGLHASIDLNELSAMSKFSIEDFYSADDASFLWHGQTFPNKDSKPKCMADIISFSGVVRTVLYKISLPLVDSVSVFEVENNANKKYCAIYGNDDQYFRIGYLDDKLFTEIHLNPKRHLRLFSAKLGLNTIIPQDLVLTSLQSNEDILNNLIGEIDFSRFY